MSDEVKITCVTDLKGSTSSTEALGHSAYLPQLLEFHDVTKKIAALTEGTWIKTTGDGDIVTFTSPDKAAQFSALLQAYYKTQPALDRPTLEIRTGMFLGLVRDGENDVFGSGVNQAARVEALSQPGKVIINGVLYDLLKTSWGAANAEVYVEPYGKHTLTGIFDPPEQELFSFDWVKYGLDNPSTYIVKAIADHLKRAAVEISNLSLNDLLKPGIIIWPVVPRNLATAIHRGQTEIIRLLALLGWQISLLIADCKAGDNYTRDYSESFRDKLLNHLRERGVRVTNIALLSEYYQPSHRDYPKVQAHFKNITSDITLRELEIINNKDYDLEKRDDIRKSPTLNFLRPALTMAAVIHLAEQYGQKVIIIAGADERIQWQRSYEISNARDKIGVIMNPVFKQDPVYQAMQKASWPIWDSEDALEQDMVSAKPTNLALWVFNLHAYIPAFPNTEVIIGGERISPQNWVDPMQIPSSVSPRALANHVWPILNPATSS